jgi:hypothetical protein
MTQRIASRICLLLGLGILGGAGAGLAAPPALDLGALAGRSAVAAFLRVHAGEAYEEATLGDFRILDLDNDGRADLIATVDYSGRRFFNNLLILHDDDGRLTVQKIRVWNMESLDGAVQDLDGDGRIEILLRRNLTPYLGARPTAAWTAVFSFDGSSWVDQSAVFPQLYDSQVLPGIERELAAPATNDSGIAVGDYRKDLLTIERDKVLRVLGRSPAAGLDWALSLAGSENPVRRIFALSILTEMGGPAAASALKVLGEDRDPEVASHALAAVAESSGPVAIPVPRK